MFLNGAWGPWCMEHSYLPINAPTHHCQLGDNCTPTFTLGKLYNVLTLNGK